MIRTVFAQKDTTIYKDIPTLNSGLDEVIELRNSNYKITTGTTAEVKTSVKSLSRILIKFNITDISSSIASGKITNPQYYLKLHTATAKNIKTDYTIEVRPISQSWDMGSGKKVSNPIIVDGASWNYKISGSVWSGSISIPIGGSTWNTAYSSSQAFSYEDTDIEMNVSSIVNAWISGGLANEGFILKFPSSAETDASEYGSLNFFSRDTHTIYPPILQVKWDDSSYSTGSLSAADITNMNISVSGLREKYKNDEIAKLSIFVRDRFPAKLYVTSSKFLTTKYLPTSSYYSIKDAHTEETLVGFDTGSTKISCNSSGSYFNFDMRGLQPERYYKFVLKIENSNNTIIVDDKFYFKVER